MTTHNIWIPGMRTTCGRRVLSVQGSTLVCTDCSVVHSGLARPDLTDERTRDLIVPVFKPSQAALARLSMGAQP